MPVAITPRQRVKVDGTISWQVPYRRVDSRGKTTQSSHSFDDIKTARRFARLIADVGVDEALRIKALWDGASPDQAYTLADWAAHHIDHLTGVQDDTLDKYRAYVANDLGALAQLPLEAVTGDAVSAWVKGMSGAGKTIKNKHGFLSAVMEHAVRSGHVAANPCKGTRLPRTITEPMVFLTQAEYATFLGYVTPYWQPLVATLFSTALRWSEATALRVSDVDLDAGTISVVRAWKTGKGGRVLGPPKSKKSRRTISIAPETVEVLRPFVDGRPQDAWVFVNQRGTPVLHQTFHENVWQPAVRLANGEPGQKPGPTAKRVARRLDESGNVITPATAPLGKRPRIHDARHSCASWLLAAGVPINYVQAHLGHESITTTVDRYGHVMPAARQAIAGALSLALTQAHPQIEG